MNLLQVSTSDLGGGAEKVAWDLFSAYRLRNHASWLMVGSKKSDDLNVIEFPRDARRPPSWARACWIVHGRLQPHENRVPGVPRLRRCLHILAEGRRGIERELGWEDFDYPGSRRLLKLLPRPPDIVHAHNLHGEYFDLRYLALLSRQMPVVLTLHDEWTITGHCAYTLGCQRWEGGCGQCPDLAVYPALQNDGTAYNWRRKQRIYETSHLYVAAPSRWLLDRVRRSMLSPRELRHIPYGVDLTVYRPEDRRKVREELNLPKDAIILLFAAQNAKDNSFKDYATIEHAVSVVAQEATTKAPVIFLALGSQQAGEAQLGGVLVRHIPFERDPARVASYYQAADIYLHAARTDNFPCTVLEAQACGTPVVATAVGGIPEQIIDGETGFLTPPGNSEAMATRIKMLLADKELRLQMGQRAAEEARRRFDLNRQVNDYLGWYQDILARHKCDRG